MYSRIPTLHSTPACRNRADQITLHARTSFPRSVKSICLILAGSLLLPAAGHAAGLTASNASSGDYFGRGLSMSGGAGLIGAYGDNQKGEDAGAAYLFRIPAMATGTRVQDVKVTATDGAPNDLLGISVSLSGGTGLAGAMGDESYRGSAYVFRGLDTATGSITQHAKLTASDGVASDSFGISTSLSGSIGLVGASGDESYRGSAYVFRGLNAATGSVVQNVKLTASDGAAGDFFGENVSLSGNIGLVGAYGDGSFRGSAYLFHSLDTALGAITQTAKLTASDGVAQDFFGVSSSISVNMGLVGARGVADNRGAAYLFRGLFGASGDVEESAKLLPSDRAAQDFFGSAVSVSGNNALVGAYGDDVKGESSGSVYLFRGLDRANGTVTEAVKLFASDGALQDLFGSSVSLDGDDFIIGAPSRNFTRGKAYSGSIDSVSTLDTGNVDKIVSGIDFVSRVDWVIGQATDGNSVTLDMGSSANVIAAGRKVYIGKNAGSDNNGLYVNGTLTATEVRVGAVGNTGNTLVLDPNGVIPAGCHVIVAPGSSIGGSGLLQGNLSLAAGARLAFEPSYDLDVRGAAALTPAFGVDDILGLDGTAAIGTYILIKNSTTNFSSIGLENLGKADARPIGGGKVAYLSAPALGILTVTVARISAPTITSVTAVKGKVGTALVSQIVATNSPTTYSGVGLPPGLRIDANTGRITGRPTKAGSFNATVRAVNAGGSGGKIVRFTISNETTKPLISVTTPLALNATTSAATYTIKGKATDNISPMIVGYRIDPPGPAGFGPYKAIRLAGTAKSKLWSFSLPTNSDGVWTVEFQAVDEARNVSTPKIVRITKN